MRIARGSILASVRQRFADRDSFDEASFGKGRRLHRIGYCGKNPHGRGDLAPGTHSVLCGDEQHKSRFISPEALRPGAANIAGGLHTSFTIGAGQFCTKPGIVFLPQGSDAESFTGKLRELVEASSRFHLLTKTIHSSYDSAIAARKTNAAVKLVAEGPQLMDDAGYAVSSAIFETDAASFQGSDLGAEIFGPATLLVRYSSRNQVLEIARSLEGHLTATIHCTEQDVHEFADLITILESKVGRLVFNGFPTGVEVTHAMVHGGPYPATSDGRSTSVGSQAIFRVTRLVCYQGFPDSALPRELQDANPLGIWRMLDGQMSRDSNVRCG